MKVTHLVGGSAGGGAAKAALALHEALLEKNIDSRVIQSHGQGDGTGQSLERGLTGKAKRFARTVADRKIGAILSRGGDGRAVSPAIFGAPTSNFAEDSDIVHLHWITDGGFRLPYMTPFPSRTVWTLHDQWPMTGGCHYALECKMYEIGCTSGCPAMGGASLASGLLQNAKRRAIRKGINTVAVSSWLARTAENSVVFAGQPIQVIPNLVDTESFWPVPSQIARQALGLDTQRKILLIGHASSSYQKGADLLAAALDNLPSDAGDFDLVGFGGVDASLKDRYARHFGRVHDAPTLRLLFSAADAFALPSRAEAFGRTVIESFACGTPVIAFSGSGPDDIITPEVGILAPQGDLNAFQNGISKLLASSEHYASACRNRAEGVYSKSIVADQYIELYKEIIRKSA